MKECDHPRLTENIKILFSNFFVLFKSYDLNYLIEVFTKILSSIYVIKKNHIYIHSCSIKDIFVENFL